MCRELPLFPEKKVKRRPMLEAMGEQSPHKVSDLTRHTPAPVYTGLRFF
jgi:hypothetical protein